MRCWPPVFSPNQRISPLLGRISGGHRAEQGRFAGPVRSGEDDAFAGRNFQIDFVQHQAATESLGHAANFDGDAGISHGSSCFECTLKAAKCGRGITAWAGAWPSLGLAPLPLGPEGNHDADQPDPSAHPEPADQRVIDQRQVDLLGLAAAVHDDVEVAAEGGMDRDFRAPLVLRAIEDLGRLKRITRPGRLVDFKLGRDDDLLAKIGWSKSA